MAVVKTVKINVDTGGSVKELKKLEKGVDKVGDEAKQTQASMATLTGGAGARFKGLITSIKSVALGFKSIGFAIAASGIGLIVITIAALTAAFKGSESGQNKFSEIMGVIGAVVGNLVDILADLGDLIIGIFSGDSDAIKSLKSFGKSLFDVVGLPLKNTIDTVKALGKAMAALFSGDIKGAFNELKNGVKDIKNNFNEAGDAIRGAGDAMGDFIEQNKKEAAQAQQVAKDRNKADKIERDLIVDKAKAEREIAELRLKAKDLNKVSVEEREAALLKVLDIQNDLIDRETEVLTLRRDAQIAENGFARSNKENLTAEQDSIAAVIEIETRRTNQKRQIQRELTAAENERSANAKAIRTEEAAAQKVLDAEEAKRVKAKELQAQKDVDDEVKRLAKIQEVEDFYFLKGLEREISNIERKAEADILELESLKAHKSLIEAVEQESSDKIAALVKTASDKTAAKSLASEEKTNKDSEDDAVRLKNAKIAIVGQGLNTIGALAKEGSTLSKGIAAAQASMNTYQGVTAALSATSVVPDPMGSALKVANAVAVGVMGLVNVKKILSTKPVMSGAPSAGVSAPPAPAFNLVEGTADNQINDSINLGNQEPIQTYVVSGDVTTAQNLENNIITESGL